MALIDNLQAFYKLSDLSDSSGNNRTLTNNGNVSFASGKIGNAGVFDGSNYLSLSENLLANKSALTVAAWIKGTDGAYIVGADQGNLLTLLANDSFNVTDSWNPVLAVTNTKDGSWHHIVGVFDGSIQAIKIYVDGLLEGTNDSGQPSVSVESGTPTNIGINGGQDFLAWNGQIDAVGIWNRALSNAEVAELYNNGTGLEVDPPNYRGEWDNFTYYGQDDVVSVNGVYWKLTGLAGWTVGGAPGLGYGWTLLAPASVGGKVSLSGRISLSGRVKFAV